MAQADEGRRKTEVRGGGHKDRGCKDGCEDTAWSLRLILTVQGILITLRGKTLPCVYFSILKRNNYSECVSKSTWACALLWTLANAVWFSSVKAGRDRLS